MRLTLEHCASKLARRRGRGISIRRERESLSIALQLPPGKFEMHSKNESNRIEFQCRQRLKLLEVTSVLKNTQVRHTRRADMLEKAAQHLPSPGSIVWLRVNEKTLSHMSKIVWKLFEINQS